MIQLDFIIVKTLQHRLPSPQDLAKYTHPPPHFLCDTLNTRLKFLKSQKYEVINKESQQFFQFTGNLLKVDSTELEL